MSKPRVDAPSGISAGADLEGCPRDIRHLGRAKHAGAAAGAGYRTVIGQSGSRGRNRIECSAPQIADPAEPFRSKIRAILGSRTEELEALAVEMYARCAFRRGILSSARRKDRSFGC